MSRRTPATATEIARPENPSRRLLLGAAISSPVLAGFGKGDPAVGACEVWLARHAEHERLGARWQEIENRLFKQHNCSRLTRAQRNRFPEKVEMDDLYDRMDALHEENLALLASLPTIAATTHRGICGKLAVAILEVCPEDHRDAHHLIASVLRDYRSMHRV